MRLFVALLVVGSGCIQDRLTHCSDRVCPVDKICNDIAGCVYPEQLTLCMNASNGESCTFHNTIGSCEQGVCLPVECGNGFVTTGEICDDGNNEDGDGCSASCLSTERCGNGVVDAPEQCDDGDDDHTDECRNCREPTCPDGIIDPPREECDGAPPQLSCVGFDRDYGAVECSPKNCQADLANSCHRFGWEHVHDASGSAFDIAADGPTVLVIMSLGAGGGADVGDDGVWIHLTGQYRSGDVQGTRVLLSTTTTVSLRDNGVWIDLPPLSLGAQIGETIFAENGTPMVLERDVQNGVCKVHAYVGSAWQAPVAIVPTSSCRLLTAAAANDFVVATGSAPSTVTRVTSVGPRVETMPANVVDIEYSAGNVVAYAYDVAQTRLDYMAIPPSGPVQTGVHANVFTAASDIVAHDDEVYGVGTGATSVLRATRGRVESTSWPLRLASQSGRLRIGRDGAVYSTGDPLLSPMGTGIYRLGAYAEAERLAPTTEGHVGSTEDQILVACDGSNFYSSRDAGWSSPVPLPVTSSFPCATLWGRAASTVYVALAGGPGGPGGVYQRSGTQWIEQMYGGNPIKARSLAGEAEKTVMVTNTSLVLLNTTGTPTGWSSLGAPPCALIVAAATVRNDTIYVGGRCVNSTGRIWRYDEATTSWNEVYDTQLNETVTSLIVAGDGTIAAATSARTVFIRPPGQTWISEANLGDLVAGTSAGDVYALYKNTSTHHSTLHRWSGQGWSPIRVDPTAKYLSLIATMRDLVVTGDATWTGFVRGH